MQDLLQKWTKYSLSVITFFIGAEIVYKFLSHYVHSKKQNDEEEDFYKAVFFPDEGILSDVLNESTWDNPECLSMKSHVNHDIHIESNLVPKYFQDASVTKHSLKNDPTALNTDSLKHNKDLINSSKASLSSVLSKSTSLIHIVNALNSAKHSLSVCVFVLSSSDLLDAIVQAKMRGIEVRVILDTGMSSHSKLSTLLKNGIPVRHCKSSHMMHNKFAIVDATEATFHTNGTLEPKDFNFQDAGTNETNLLSCKQSPFWGWKSLMHEPSAKQSESSKRGVLITGSFNWTWSAVVSNYENVIITNDRSLINAYSVEFDKLWSRFSIS